MEFKWFWVLPTATISSTVGFHQRLDRVLHLRVARGGHLPAEDVLLVGEDLAPRKRAPAGWYPSFVRVPDDTTRVVAYGDSSPRYKDGPFMGAAWAGVAGPFSLESGRNATGGLQLEEILVPKRRSI